MSAILEFPLTVFPRSQAGQLLVLRRWARNESLGEDTTSGYKLICLRRHKEEGEEEEEEQRKGSSEYQEKALGTVLKISRLGHRGPTPDNGKNAEKRSRKSKIGCTRIQFRAAPESRNRREGRVACGVGNWGWETTTAYSLIHFALFARGTG